MARGLCFEIRKNIQDIGSFDEGDLYDDLDALCIDYVRNIPDVSAREDRELLLDQLALNGALTGTDVGIPFFILSDEVKCTYFKDRFSNVKKIIDRMTLKDFACRDPFVLRTQILNTVSDCVYIDYAENLDTFIREAECGVKYYIGNVVLMH